jgi:hypothetical protein
MKRLIFFAAGAVAIAGIALAEDGGAASTALPKRKAGHWEITTVSAATGMAVTQACVGADDDLAVPAGSDDRSEPKVTPAGPEIIVDVVCSTPGGKETMSTVYSGDFNSRYRAVMKMTFDPPGPLGRTLGVTIDGRYVGPDCSGAAN